MIGKGGVDRPMYYIKLIEGGLSCRVGTSIWGFDTGVGSAVDIL